MSEDAAMSEHAEKLAKAGKDVEKSKEAFRKYLQKRQAKKKLTSKQEDIDHILEYHPRFYNDLAKSLTQQLSVMSESSYGSPLPAGRRQAAEEAGGEEADVFMKTELGAALVERSAVITKARDALESLRELKKLFLFKIEQAKGIIKQIEVLRKYDFINGVLPSGVSSGIVFYGDMSAMQGGISKLEARQNTVDGLINTFSAALAKSDKEEKIVACENAFEKLDKKSDKIFLILEEASKSFADALDNMTVTVEDDALDAYVAASSQTVKNLAAAKAATDLTIGMLGAFLKKSNLTGALFRLDEFLSAASVKVMKEAAIQKGMNDYRAAHAKTEVYDEHSQDPLLMALRLVDRQKDALDLVLKGIGATLAGGLYVTPPGTAEIVLGAWDVAAKVAEKTLETYLEERIDKAKKTLTALKEVESGALTEKISKAFEDAYGEVEKKVTDLLTGKLKEGVTEGLKLTRDFLQDPENIETAISTGLGQEDGTGKLIAKFDPFKLSEMIVQFVVPPIVDAIMKVLPPRPAELWSGKDLMGIINEIHFSQKPLNFFVTVKPTSGGQLKQFSMDDPVKKLLKENESWNFWRTNSGATAFANDKDKVLYCASVASPKTSLEVWGYYNPRTKEWIPDHLDQAAFTTNWSDYKIYATGISTKSYKNKPPETPGKWYTVVAHEASEHEASMSYIMFMPDGGDPMWGRQMDMAYKARGPKYSLGMLVEKFAKPYPGNMVGLMKDIL